MFRLLKQQGYYVIANVANDYAMAVLQHNPNVDEIAPQLRGLVPIPELDEYNKELARGCDRFVNLTGCTEEALLIPDTKYYLTLSKVMKEHPEAEQRAVFEEILKEYRKIVNGKNYYDAHLERAGFSERGLNGELYFSDTEELVARDFRYRTRDRFLVLWSLSGSSYHKWYPYVQHAIQGVLDAIPEALVITVGDEACQLMEKAESPRYHPRSGKWSLRHSLIMTKYADLVVGPETGILNAAGCFDTPKITLLSHSTHDNLCKYWKNDYCLAPEDTFCHPCHMLHYVHPNKTGEKCYQCGVEHNEKAVTPGGIWSCPYINLFPDGKGEGTYFPLCVGHGMPPERVIARILEVYRRWRGKGKQFMEEPPNGNRC